MGADWGLIGVLFEVLMAARAHLFKIDGRVLGGMQFGVLAQMLFWVVTVQAHVCILTVGCKGGTQFRWWFGITFGVLVDFRKIDGWVSWGVLLGVLFRVMVRAHFA